MYHNIIDRVEPFAKEDILELWTFPDNTDYLTMMAEEDKLIAKYKPLYSVPVYKYGMNQEKGERTCPMCKKSLCKIVIGKSFVLPVAPVDGPRFNNRGQPDHKRENLLPLSGTPARSSCAPVFVAFLYRPEPRMQEARQYESTEKERVCSTG